MTNLSIQHVYARSRDYCLPIDMSIEPEPLDRDARSLDAVSVRRVMTREVICVRDDLDLETAIELVTSRRVGCLPVVDADGFPIGVVTKLDLLEEIAARGDGAPASSELRQVMMPIAFTLGDHATVAHAAMMMHVEGVHHVPIVATDGRLIGVVSSLDIVHWLVAAADRSV